MKSVWSFEALRKKHFAARRKPTFFTTFSHTIRSTFGAEKHNMVWKFLVLQHEKYIFPENLRLDSHMWHEHFSKYI